MVQLKLSHINLFVIALVMGSSHAESAIHYPPVEGNSCQVKDDKGNALLDKDGNPLMGKYRKKAANTQPATEGLTIAAPEATLAPPPLLFLDPKNDESLNKILTFPNLHSIESEDLKSFKVEGTISNISNISQTLTLKILQFETEQSATPFSESSLKIDNLAKNETRPFTTNDQPLSPRRGHIVIKAEFPAP